ncbi:cobalamin B12-binding domain-containing protein [Alterisphingorhabdus coralli]|uniref:Cobalamin-dependent protein n=1 Tax=Alterisphingorhabdus coralli TaxID=3071408 RepID=A0AA97F5X6_9SPHN|nr:cobalamin-dependent protein [Parasphingorhabdus sp. SCSIO 66989]WOE74533.1 cobalamin-dependent protein [Parasphingorhabdus sp. SCSIO 66989]
MASVFGIAELRSRLDGWRTGKKPQDDLDPDTPDIVFDPNDLRSASDGGDDLSVVVENLVIPKLIAERPNLHGAVLDDGHCSCGSKAISKTDVEYFVLLALEGDARKLLDFVDSCLSTGSSVETIYVDLLAPAARRLGDYWDEDSVDFVDVTMGLWRVQEILRELTLHLPPKFEEGHGQRSALFSTMPGEQHSLGTLMVAECFQRAGWDADVLMEPTRSELTGKFANRYYDLIGLTVSLDCPTDAITNLIKAIRAVSTNPEIKVLLGGRVINDQPELVQLCGADGTADDAPSAVKVAEELVPLRTSMFEKLA